MWLLAFLLFLNGLEICSSQTDSFSVFVHCYLDPLHMQISDTSLLNHLKTGFKGVIIS